MYQYSDYEKAAEAVRGRVKNIPEILLVLGSGMGSVFDKEGEAVPYDEIPGFSKTTAPMHKGKLIITEKAFIMCGRWHYYEGYSLEEITFYIRVMKLLGVKKIILTNAAGGVNSSFSVGDIVLITDHIKFTSDSPLRGENDERFGERFTDLHDAYSRRLRDEARQCAGELGIGLKEGVYFYMSGPTYETPAEIRAISLLGADLVGMSTVHECIAANHCGMEVLGISCVTNMACGIGSEPLSSAEVEAAANENKDKIKRLLKGIIERLQR